MSPFTFCSRPAAIVLALALLTGCDERPESSSPSTSSSSPHGDSIVLRDAMGETTVLTEPARRIVSLAPSLTELVFAIGADDRLIGRTEFCNYPPRALEIEVVGDLRSVNYERLIALRPDLVLMTYAGNSQAAYRKLKELGLRAFVFRDESIDGVMGTLDTLGMMTGQQSQAAATSAMLQRTIDSIHALAKSRPPVTTFVLVDKTPLITVSRGFLAEVIALAGGKNIAEGMSAAYPVISREELLRLDPEVILIPGDNPEISKEVAAIYPEWNRLRAVRTDRVHLVPADVVFRPGPRLGESITLLYRVLHQAKADSVVGNDSAASH